MYSRKIYRQTPPGYSGTAISPVEEMPDVRFLRGRDGGRASGSEASGGSGSHNGRQQNGRVYTQRIPVPPLPLEGEKAGYPSAAGQPAGQPAAGQQAGQPSSGGSRFAVINQNMTALRDTVGWLVGQLHANDNEKREVLQGKDLKGQDPAPDREGESAPAAPDDNRQSPAPQMPAQQMTPPPATPVPPIAPAVPIAPVPPTVPNAQPAPQMSAPLGGEKETYEGENDTKNETTEESENETTENPYLSAYYHRHPEARPTNEGRKRETTRLTGAEWRPALSEPWKPAEPSEPAEPSQPAESSHPVEPSQPAESSQPAIVPTALPSQLDGQRGGQTDGQRGGQTDGQRGGQTDGQRGGQTDGQHGGQTDGRYDSQTNGQTAREKAAPSPDVGSRKIQEIFQEIEKRGLTSRELLLLGIGLLLST